MLAGTSAYSYVKTGYHSVRDSIKEQIPIEVEIKRARDMIADLKPEIADNLKLIARELAARRQFQAHRIDRLVVDVDLVVKVGAR